MTMHRTTSTANDLTVVNPPSLFNPAGFGYSQAVITPGGARIAYISGQGGADATGALSPDFAGQVAQAYPSLRAALDGVGAKPEQVVKLAFYVVDHDPSKLGALTRPSWRR